MIRHRIRNWFGRCAVALAAGAVVSPSFAATPAEVQAAIEKGQKYLISKENKDGNWEVTQTPVANGDAGRLAYNGRQFGALTGLVTYSLLASGESPQSKEMQRPIEFVLSANVESTYGLGMGSQVVLPDFKVGTKQIQPLLKRNIAVIEAGLHAPTASSLKNPESWGKEVGFYGYWTGGVNGTNQPKFNLATFNPRNYRPQPGDWYDRSNSQYAVLGMWALADAGGEVPTLWWWIEDQAWKKAQLADGGWGYHAGDPPTASMTAAGIATLFLTQDFTSTEDYGICHGGVKNKWIEKGLHWMDQHIIEALNGNLYTMYGIERIGTASGRRFFGTRDWYQIGADMLVKHQNKDGSFMPGGYAGGDEINATAFALLFLSRGRAPVMMNKLQYQSAKAGHDVVEPWDERPRDVANLARWVGHEEDGIYLNWQVVNLTVPAEDLHDSPILYISGSQTLDFSKADVDKLRAFVEQGGLILGNADCNRPAFSQSFTRLGHVLFPKYEFKKVAQSDLIYSEQFKKWRNKPLMMELSNNVRKLMLLIPESDPSRRWQSRAFSNYPDMYGLGTNIYLYSVGNDRVNMLAKGATYLIKPDKAITATRTIKVARLNVGDNPDPEPFGWVQLAADMHNKLKTDVTPALVKADALKFPEYKIAHLTGTGKLSLGPAQQSAIKQFVQAGGTLIIDAAGGDVEFATSAGQALGAMFPGSKLAQLPANSPIYNQVGAKIVKAGWRRYALERISDRKHPHIEGIAIGGREAVLFSREDLSGGLVGQPVDGILGYSPETAMDLMAGMLLYAEHPQTIAAAEATTAPATVEAPGTVEATGK